MPLAIRPPGSPREAEAEFIERLPDWRSRDLTATEVDHLVDLVALWLEKSGFSHRQIGQVLFRDSRTLTRGREKVSHRLQNMKQSFDTGGFSLVSIP
jgi:hypothetical protein